MDRSASCELFGLSGGLDASFPNPSAEAVVAEQRDTRILCHCLRVTYGEVSAAIATYGCQTVRCVMKKTMAGGGCTACHRRIRQLLAEAQANQPKVATEPSVRETAAVG